jgi:hypothetical protein
LEIFQVMRKIYRTFNIIFNIEKILELYQWSFKIQVGNSLQL